MLKTSKRLPAIIEGPSIGQAYEAFRLRCEAQGLSKGTLVWYGQLFKNFGRFLEPKELTKVSQLTASLIREYLSYLRQSGNCSGTVARTYGGLRCFFGFLSREGYVPDNPIAAVEKPRMERKLIQPLSVEQVRALLAQPKFTTFMSQRTWTLMVLILDTGLRIAEALNLRMEQVDLAAGVLRVMGKGGKERQVPMGSTSKQAFMKYLARRGEIREQDLVFVSRFGLPLDRGTVGKAFRRIGRRANVRGVRLSPHTLRHTFATHYVMNGGDVFSLQQILGHSSLEMVKVYVKLANRDVAEQHRRFSPIDNLGVVPGTRQKVVLR